jgi:hypothetical protein
VLTRVQAHDSNPADTGKQLDEQLRALGLYAAPTLGDGNCLFRALADQLHGSPAGHAPLREQVCAWIARHEVLYAPFCDDERGLDAHLRAMRQLGSFLTLHIFMIFIYSVSQPHMADTWSLLRSPI